MILNGWSTAELWRWPLGHCGYLTTSYLLRLPDSPLSFHISRLKETNPRQLTPPLFPCRCDVKAAALSHSVSVPRCGRTPLSSGTRMWLCNYEKAKNKGDNGVMGSLVCRLSFVKGCSACACFVMFVYSLTTVVTLWVEQREHRQYVSFCSLCMYCVLSIC